ncbi:MAG: hypothetical protein SGILL_007407, partial [Bacillariaceae sp.]
PTFSSRAAEVVSPSPVLFATNPHDADSEASSFFSEFSGCSGQNRKYNVSLLLIDHYDSFTYNLYDMLAQLTVEPPVVVAKDIFESSTNDDKDDLQDFFDAFDGIVLSPGPGTPHEQPSLSHRAISDNPDKPLLGVCLGHQLMALAYGAKVDRAPTPIHGQDHWIVQENRAASCSNPQNSSFSMNATVNNDAAAESIVQSQHPSLFDDLPNSFRVVRYHSLCAYDLPQDDSLIVTAKSNDNVIQAMQHSNNPHYGLQFHPESIGTQFGMGLLENFLQVVQQHNEEEKDMEKLPSSFKTLSLDKILEKIDRPPDPPQQQSNSKQRQEPTMAEPTKPQRFRVMIQRMQSSSIQPLQVFERYYARESHSVWLDSSSYPSRGELDILAAPTRPEDILEYHRDTSDTDILTMLEDELFGYSDVNGEHQYGPSKTIGWINSTSGKQALDSAFLEWIDETTAESATLEVDRPPFHYRGGFLGFLGYEVRHETQRYLRELEGGRVKEIVPTRQEDGTKENGTPTAAFFLARQSLVFHHPTESWYLVGLVEEEKDVGDNVNWMNSVIDDFNQWEANDVLRNQPASDDCFAESGALNLEFVPNRPQEVYGKDIERCHEFIRQGESYELCLTNQLETCVKDSKRSAFGLYKDLRKGNPAPYSAYLRWNVQSRRESETAWSDIPNPSSLIICSSSPERFMSISRQQPHPEVSSFLQAEAKPIKGTAARVIPQDGLRRTDAESREDERRARSLELSLKNRAENLMIVDLLRNDLSRVCQVGTVHVSKLMDIESFATVHQMVSTIRGTLGDSQTSIDLLRASFPGGSMTGAPKIRTMELLEELERDVDRGPYSGSLGYISVNGCMDMNIIIRTAVLTLADDVDAWKVGIGAGGAITALSEVEDEYDEMKLKARAVVSAVQKWASRPAVDSSVQELTMKNTTNTAPR